MAIDIKDGAGLAVTLKSRTDGSDEVPAHDTIPLATYDATWLVDQPMNADTNYAGLDCQRFGTVWLEFIMAATAEGDLYIEWSMDDVTYYPFAIDFGKYSVVDPGSKLTITEGEGKVAVAALAAETRFAVGIEKPPPYLRGRWDFTAGTATGMDGRSFGRA